MPDAHTIRVLIVEDEALVTEMIWSLLESAGYQVAGAARTGRQAVELTQTLRPDVLVLDINLPDIDGLEVARRLLQARPTPVVVLTAHQTPELVAEASAAGVGAFLTKPPDPQELDRALRITLARFADLQALRHLNAALQDKIVQHQQAEAALRDSEARFRSVLDYSLDAAYRRNLHTNTLDYLSPAIFQIAGYSVEEMVNQPFDGWLALMHPDDALAITQANQVSLTSPGQPQQLEYRFRHKAGHYCWFQDLFTTVYDAQGQPALRVGTLRDITEHVRSEQERQRAEEEIRRLNADLEQRVEARTAELSARSAELRQANTALTAALRVKDEFLATMSHELRTPLAAMMGLAEALTMNVYGPLTQKQAKMLQTIHASGQHLLNLITDVLDYAQAEAGPAPDSLGAVAVADLCQACLNAVLPAAQQKNLRLSLEMGVGTNLLRTDGQRLRRMLLHLLDNAIKFTPDGGAAGLTVVKGETAGPAPQPEIRFIVWDTGIGIAPADQGRLFQPFVQLDSRLARKYEGAGLGLALVQRLAKQHGGRVVLESTGVPGEGSRFILCLPLIDG